MTLVAHMPVAAGARLMGVHDTRLWRVVFHYVQQAVARMDLASLRRVCIDETAAKRGHDYISVFADIDTRRVVFVTDGRDASTVSRFADQSSLWDQLARCLMTGRAATGVEGA